VTWMEELVVLPMGILGFFVFVMAYVICLAPVLKSTPDST
jgi:hypothetical protein